MDSTKIWRGIVVRYIIHSWEGSNYEVNFGTKFYFSGKRERSWFAPFCSFIFSQFTRNARKKCCVRLKGIWSSFKSKDIFWSWFHRAKLFTKRKLTVLLLNQYTRTFFSFPDQNTPQNLHSFANDICTALTRLGHSFHRLSLTNLTPYSVVDFSAT